MPPKNKYTKEEIVRAAYELVREKGIDALAAREVGKKLNTSSSPIFTVFSSMDELKNEVYQKGLTESCDYLFECMDYEPAFKEYGMRFVKLALSEPNIYQMLFEKIPSHSNYVMYSNDFVERLEPLIEEIMDCFNLNREQAKTLLNEMTIHAHGIGSLCVNNVKKFEIEEISKSLSAVCLGLVVNYKLSSGNFDLDEAKFNLAHPGIVPQKKK